MSLSRRFLNGSSAMRSFPVNSKAYVVQHLPHTHLNTEERFGGIRSFADRRFKRYEIVKEKHTQWEEYLLEDAEYVVVATIAITGHLPLIS